MKIHETDTRRSVCHNEWTDLEQTWRVRICAEKGVMGEEIASEIILQVYSLVCSIDQSSSRWVSDRAQRELFSVSLLPIFAHTIVRNWTV